jgi:hypothetical protein
MNESSWGILDFTVTQGKRGRLPPGRAFLNAPQVDQRISQRAWVPLDWLDILISE